MQRASIFRNCSTGIAVSPNNRPVRIVLLAQTLLWLAASAFSGLLVYWLYISPAYGMHWTSIPGALLFALVCVCAGAGCLINLAEVLTDIARPADGQPRRRAPASHNERVMI